MEKDLNPYEFTLEIDGQPSAIRVEHPKADDYIVYINGERSGHIHPVRSGDNMHWTSEDQMDQALLNRIGQQIEAIDEAGRDQ